ncbi:hypothetical protein NVP1123O_33 [Vibrio phage 1.123.O._10N.286.48.F3]|nr:hypothetical protein NVP1123O_33 [Vibrio phage 1.123.O._10N.286.48.F3]
MPIKEVSGRKFDFFEMNLEQSCEIMEKVPALLAVAQGQPMPQGTLIFCAERIFKGCLVDGYEMKSIGEFFKGDDRSLFVPALLAGAEVNFPDFFTKLKGLIGSNSTLSKMAGMNTDTSNPATAEQQAPSSK